jgi:hypothetical protein
MSKTISNRDDLIDSRDVIARIEELQEEINGAEISEDNGATAQRDDNGTVVVETATCGNCDKEWNDALISGSTPTPSGRCPYEAIHKEIAELKALEALQEEAEGYCPDWKYGATLIADSYFEDYAQELAEDLGYTGGHNKPLTWPFTCIDWEKAADELQQDYTAVEFDGVTYWVR